MFIDLSYMNLPREKVLEWAFLPSGRIVVMTENDSYWFNSDGKSPKGSYLVGFASTAPVKASTNKAVMPLIAFDQWSKRSHVEQQRDADQKVLESAQVMMDSMIKLIEKLEAKEKEWAKKEADWLENLLPTDSTLLNTLIAAKIAELRKVSGEK